MNCNEDDVLPNDTVAVQKAMEREDYENGSTCEFLIAILSRILAKMRGK